MLSAATGQLQDGEQITLSTGWIGDHRPLFASLHLPAHREVRGGVLIFSPVGHDYQQVHLTMRQLSERLARAGFASLRFDYDGAGDSAGRVDDPDRVECWLRSGTEAARVIRECGVNWTAAVGMRVGAVLAALVAERIGGLDALVLWDPIGGKSFVSEQRALARLSFGLEVRDDDAVEIPGVLLTPDTVQGLRGVDINRAKGPVAARVLCLERADRSPDERLSRWMADHHAESGVAVGQHELLDADPPYQPVPAQAIDTIVDWLRAAAPAETAGAADPALQTSVCVAHTADGSPIVESTFVAGTAGLFGIRTEPPRPTGGPTIVLINPSNEHRVGPNRLWVTLARKWAEAGLRSVRFDLSGLGDSGTWAGQRLGRVRVPEHFDDILELAAAVSPADPSDVVLVGLCSSAYQAVDSAFHLKPRGICAVNPRFSFMVPEMADNQPMDPRRRVARHRSNLIASFGRGRTLWPLMRRFPNALWFCRNLISPRRPARWMNELAASNVVSFYLVGEFEARQVEAGSARKVRRLTSAGRLAVRVVPNFDHGLMAVGSLQVAADELTKQVVGRFGAPAPAPADSAPRRPALLGSLRRLRERGRPKRFMANAWLRLHT